jgi:hypothetical protein
VRICTHIALAISTNTQDKGKDLCMKLAIKEGV